MTGFTEFAGQHATGCAAGVPPARTVEFATEFATQRRWARVREGRFKVIVPAETIETPIKFEQVLSRAPWTIAQSLPEARWTTHRSEVDETPTFRSVISFADGAEMVHQIYRGTLAQIGWADFWLWFIEPTIVDKYLAAKRARDLELADEDDEDEQ